MKNDSNAGIQPNDYSACVRHTIRRELKLQLAALGLGIISLFSSSGCQSTATPLPSGANSVSQVQTIREGDVLKVSFPDSPNLDATQPVRRDGRITLQIIGDVVAAGMTPEALQSNLIQQFSTQLVSKELTVSIVSSTFPVFVSGAVLKPGRFTSEHPITVLEAVMEAGGFDPTKANTEAVVVIRQEGGVTRNYTVNLKDILDGKTHTSFYLQPSDIVYVPEKFSWF